MGSDCGRRIPERPVSDYRPPAVAVAPLVCGDGVVAPGEQCDDGNIAFGDGCSACQLEAPQCAPGTDGLVWKWACRDSPSKCELESCAANECAPELATRTLAVKIRLEGFVDQNAQDTSRIIGAGFACSACREKLGGVSCE